MALFLLLVPSVGAGPLIVAVVPNLPGPGPGDEGFALGSDQTVQLFGYSVTDGETIWRLPEGLRLSADEPAWFTGDADKWRSYGGPAAFAYPVDALQLSNGGETLRLVDGQGLAVDSFAWGEGSPIEYTSEGLVYERRRVGGEWADTGKASDWITPREHRIGESHLDSPTWEVDSLTLYSSPDSSFEVMTGLIEAAQERLHLHVYEFRSRAMADAIVGALVMDPDLDVRILVDRSPVGLGSDERHEMADALHRIQEAGGDVVLAGHSRYRYHHLKVLVSDSDVAVQSENWVDSGVPEDASWGNRGWGVVVHSKEAADWFARLMRADRDAWDTIPFQLSSFDPTFERLPRLDVRVGEYYPAIASRTLHGDFVVRPLVAPDHTQDPESDPVVDLMQAAETRIWMQQLDVALDGRNHLGWSSQDAWVGSLIDASHRGLDVRVQLAQPFSADDQGNRDAIAWLEEEAPDIRTSVMERPGIATLHNKGLVIDQLVVLGSTNGNHHSRSSNREVSLILEGPGVAGFYSALMASDSVPASRPRDWGVPLQDLRAMPASPLPILLAVLGVVVSVRR